jgi:thiol-disulfide isomerase/thioredoxin
MRSTYATVQARLPIVVLLLASGGAAGQDNPLAPADKFKAIAESHRAAADAFNMAYNAAKTEEDRKRVLKEKGNKASPNFYAPQMLEVVRAHANDAASLDATRWLLARVPYAEETRQAINLLIQNRIEDESLELICASLYYYHCDAGDRLLRAAIAKSPHRKVQGLARFNLAVSLQANADRMARDGPKARQPLEMEAERLLQEVVDKYGDLKRDLKRDDSTLGKLAEANLFSLRHLAVGKVAPDIEGKDLDGKPLKLSGHRGKVVLLVYWATWCGPCMADVPRERALVKRLAGKPFAILGINADKDQAAAQKASVKEEMPWQSIWDGEAGPIVTRWNVDAWPTLYLLDTKGVIRYKGNYLRTSSFDERRGGQYYFLDVAVDELMDEL